MLHLRRSKTDQEGQGREVAIPRIRGKFCPCRCLSEWLSAAGIQEGAVFRSINQFDQASSQRLSGQSVALIIKRHVQRIGLDPKNFSGHSLRLVCDGSGAMRRGNVDYSQPDGAQVRCNGAAPGARCDSSAITRTSGSGDVDESATAISPSARFEPGQAPSGAQVPPDRAGIGIEAPTAVGGKALPKRRCTAPGFERQRHVDSSASASK